ncbi:hypothetical protein [Psittacicella gerlachiana]|uniref:Uncharacterized protein n=1 Tax=Psittacicella gerlachiana TaxID=2028574 RepID=A0A3A1YDA9_9GAMM|nr:hypothetical protein [Psittacicella gerlachiana]RIY35366.1 hypothetical protein CKF59_03690 [Psittacicella gerlachiana]
MSEKEISFAELSSTQDQQLNSEFTLKFEELIGEFDNLMQTNTNLNEQLVIACSLLKNSIELNKQLLEKLKK